MIRLAYMQIGLSSDKLYGVKKNMIIVPLVGGEKVCPNLLQRLDKSFSTTRELNMGRIKTVIVVFLLVLCQSCRSQQLSDVAVSAPSIEQEATSIWRTINDIEFLEGQGYKINLPEDSLIDTLISKSKSGQFGNDNFREVYTLLERNIYQEVNYKAALDKVNNQEELLKTLMLQLRRAKESWKWDFELLPSYDVIFTLYGTGGSYDPDHGRVVLFTTLEGGFMRYKDPANTIIHEIVHLGIETSIVQKYKLSHRLKEKIVDKIVFLLFAELLPEYRMQDMGSTEIDEYLKQKEDLVDLESIVEEIVN